MEDQFDAPMLFDASQVPPVPFVPSQGRGAWSTEVAVSDVARSHRRATSTTSLMEDMYGFVSEEEIEETKAYLKSHGIYQVEQVGKWGFILRNLLNNWTIV